MKIEPRLEDDNFMLAWVSLSHVTTRLRETLEYAFQEELGISLAEQDMLKQIAVNEGLTLTEIAKRIYFSKAGLTKMLDRLEAQDLVKRQPDLKDRRVIRAIPTAKGKRVLTKSRDILRATMEREFRAHLSDKDLKQLNQSLRSLLQSWGAWEGQVAHLKGEAHD